MILLIDNYDSFVHNLARYFERLGQETLVVRNDAIDPAAARRLSPQVIVLSPGPGEPASAGCSVGVAGELAGEIPILGVCLGHQAIAAAVGGRIVRGRAPMHGRASRIEHEGGRLFAGLPSPLTVGRYHSLIVQEASLSQNLRVTARSSEGEIMAFEHVAWPLYGVQFHPESILTEHGYALLANFLELAGLPRAAELPQELPGPRTTAPAADSLSLGTPIWY